MKHGARTHAKYGSSAAHRVIGCPGHVALAASLPPQEDSESSALGTLAHEVVEARLTKEPLPAGATPDMISDASVVEDFVESLALSRGESLDVCVEWRALFPQKEVASQDAGGIADLIVYSTDEQELWSVDYKYGMVPVEAERNAQLLYNATAAAWWLPVRKVNCVIIQPRVTYHPKGIVRSWSCDAVTLAEFQIEMEAAIAAAEAPGAPLRPGPHCRYCPAEAVCPAKERAALAVVDTLPLKARDVQSATLLPPEQLDPARIAYVLRHADTLKSWLKAVEKHAYAQARRGVYVPGHKLVEAQAARKWNGEPDEVARQLAGLAGIEPDEFMPPTLVGVTEAERVLVKAVRAKADKGKKGDDAVRVAKERMAFLTLRQTSGELVLVDESDPRPAANRAAAAFGGVTILPPS